MYKTLLISLLLINTQVVIADSDLHKKVESRMQSFNIPDEMEINLWADQSLTQNPTFFSFDSQGRLLVSEIYRINKGVDDIRGYSKALSIADIYIKSNDDRLKMYQDFHDQLPPGHLDNVSDKIRLLEDTDQNGKADKSTLYADEFNGRLDGLGSGVIERNGKVYYTNIPHLWELEDQNNDGVSDKRTSLQDGFGTRVSFMGHDMHGLAWGPEGRLYWSIGDRGYDITTKEGNKFLAPNRGAVFRSNPDGSNLEVFYHGVRNPQELVFDEYGNLFTADNDGDHGDTERINHLIEGGDSGWHAGHQSIMSFTKRFALRSSKYTGESRIPLAWLVNDMSAPRNDNQPAFMLPGIGQLFTGPSGFTYNPSNYLGEKWRNSFFVALYGGSPAGSYISTFKNTPNGASFLTSKPKEMLRGMNVTDIDFGPDGNFYISEFNFGGWEPKNEGAIYSLNTKALPNDITQKNKQYYEILTSDFSQKTFTELTDLLAIDHQKIRQRAQFEMADRGKSALAHFSAMAINAKADTFSRIHSIWGISQLVLSNSIAANALKPLLPLLSDNNDQVRIQVAKVLASHKATFAESVLIKALNDKHNQVAMYAAYALGKINSKFAVKSIVNKLNSNKDKDLWLRHALTMALKGIDKKHWINYKNHTSADVRLGILLTLRLLSDDDVAYFLNDKNTAVMNEAIIAIDDKSLVKVREKMAALLSPTMASTLATEAYIHHRIINANFNEGQKVNAERLLTYAAHNGLPDRLAAEALAAIEGWNDINPIDTITGLPTQANKKRADITALIHHKIAAILAVAKDKALVQAMRLAGHVNYVLPTKLLSQIAGNTLANTNIRAQALELLHMNASDKAQGIAQSMLKESPAKVRSLALTYLFKNTPTLALKTAEQYLGAGEIINQKIALAHLTQHSNEAIDALLIKNLNALLSNTHNPALTLELLDAAANNTNAEIQALLERYTTNLAKTDVNTQFASTLKGGDAEIGKDIVFGGGAAQCIRCHRVNEQGSYVGPNLSNIATKHNSQYLLEALIDPSAAIAPGYGTVSLVMKDKNEISGVFFNETPTSITIGKNRQNTTTYDKANIQDIKRPVSGMPPMRYILSKTQIRDILAYLNTLKTAPLPAGH